MYTLKSDAGGHDILTYMKFMREDHVGEKAYDCHVAPEITQCIGMQGVFTIEGRDYEIKDGDIFIIRSNEKHKITKVTKAGYVENLKFDTALIWQGGNNFDINYLSIFNTQTNVNSNRLDRNNPACDKIKELLNSINGEFKNKKYGYAHMIKMHVYTMLLVLIRDFGFYQEGGTRFHAPHVEAIRNSMKYIDDNLCERLTLPELANVASLSTNYYGTLFKQLNGITPVEYITSKRVLRAISMLPDFDGTMLELALACGFNNTANFNRAFRAYTGQVPSKYVPPMM